MLCLTSSTPNLGTPFLPTRFKPQKQFTRPCYQSKFSICNSYQEPEGRRTRRRRRLLEPILNPAQNRYPSISPANGKNSSSNIMVIGSDEERQVWALCGLGYWVQGFRCFPWLALNFHMANALGLSPSKLQLVQHSANLPLVAKPLFGVISDAVYIGGAHRIPYISIGVLLQAMSWGALTLIPSTGDAFSTQMACILLTNVGASFTEVVSDALVAELSRTQKVGELQSYALIALAAGGVLGNLSGGLMLLGTQEPKFLFFTFALLLTFQLALSLTTKETSLHSLKLSSCHLVQNSLSENLSRQFSELMTAINEKRIIYRVMWIVASIAVVPVLSGSMFCFQTQCLNLDPVIIGLSKVVGQSMVLSMTVFYNRYLKRLPMRSLIFGTQIVYALALLSDIVLVKQINLKLGISNEVYVLCLSALAEAVAQFKILPFAVLFSSLCPPGCEGSLFAFFASALCLSSIVSGILGVGLASFLGVSSGNYSSLPLGIVIQSLASLVPLSWISKVPATRNLEGMKRKTRNTPG